MSKVPRSCLVDSNVPIVANGRSHQANDDLVEKCIDALLEITRQGGLVLDSEDRIFDEYRDNLNLSGQPGTWDAFMKWVHDHRWNEQWCELRTITCTDESNQIFAPGSGGLPAPARQSRRPRLPTTNRRALAPPPLVANRLNQPQRIPR